MLFENPAAAYKRDTEAFYNPQITKVEVTIDGVPNQLYSQGLRAYNLWSLPKLDLTARDAGMVFMNVSFAILTKDELIKRGIIPSNISL